MLTGGPLDQPARQRTIRNTIAWSHDLLTADEQAIFRHLAVFTGGFTLEAAETVCDPAGDLDVFAGLAALQDQSLVRREDGADGEPRFRMLETIREFGLERLAEHGEEVALRDAHAAWCLALAKAAAPDLEFGRNQARWVPRLDAELANLRAALAWVDARRERDVLLPLVAALATYWWSRGQLVEGRAWTERAIAAAEGVAPGLRWGALLWAGWYARLQGDGARARSLGDAALALAQARGDEVDVAKSLDLLAIVDLDEGALEQARDRWEAVATTFRLQEDPEWIATTTQTLGWVAYGLGNLAQAESLIQEALGQFRDLGMARETAIALSNLGEIALIRGDYQRAAELYQERLALTWDAWGIRFCLEGLAMIAASAGEAERAARLFGASEAYREAIGTTGDPGGGRDAYEAQVQATKTTLGEERFAAAWAVGRALTVEEARAEAAQVARAPEEPACHDTAADPARGAGLTPRELVNLRHLAEGHSHREIAEALFISRRTGDNHASNLNAKLDAQSSRAAVATARRLGIL